ncbi:HNH homing endonuclease [Bacillus phage Stahl]|uniref:HNH homing endonuclease n=1 Tax=Bacillus phage Stahl TaxID=1610832 RepID=A0A0E3GMP6_9CAUD|nr:HNH homing endonuclease [Bacillus phage Stahl]AKA61524.1 HNH homing endonuclease [Bacillus phage Stahl]
MENEIWKDIEGYEGYYQVSDYGRIRSLTRVIKGKTYKSRIMKPKVNSYGYHMITLTNKEQIRKNHAIHRLVAFSFIKNDDPINRKEVNHIDGKKENNEHSNLEWSTRSENMKHAFKTGLASNKNRGLKPPIHYGSDNINTKLNEDDVRFIRKHFKARDKLYNSYSLANMFDVRPSTIKQIVNRKTWKHVV